MRILIDIDGTIARGNISHFLKLCNRSFKLGLDERRLESLSRADFLDLPEVVACRAERGEQRFDAQFQWLRFTASALRGMTPIAGAQAGVTLLSEQAPVSYYTARMAAYSGSDERRSATVQKLNAGMIQGSQQWLTAHDFPNPKQVICCDGPRGKLLKIVELVEETDEPCLLVDDLYTELLSAEIDEQTKSLLSEHLTLIAYRASTVPDDAWLTTIALPSWREVDALKKEIFYVQQQR